MREYLKLPAHDQRWNWDTNTEEDVEVWEGGLQVDRETWKGSAIFIHSECCGCTIPLTRASTEKLRDYLTAVLDQEDADA